MYLGKVVAIEKMSKYLVEKNLCVNFVSYKVKSLCGVNIYCLKIVFLCANFQQT